MKKGFTLIELLAVIVILAIIALIATPIILGIINDAREESNERSVELYASAVRNGIAAYQLREGKEIEAKTYTKDTLPFEVEYDGKVDCTSIVISEDGKVSLEGCTVNGGTKEYSYGMEEETPVAKVCSIEQQDENKYSIGDVVICNIGEPPDKFYVIEEKPLTATTIQMLTEKNIHTTEYRQSDGAGTVAFSTSNYWSSTASSYPSDVYDSNSNLYQYVNAYETYLKDNGVVSASATLISYEQVNDLKTNKGNPSWLYNTYYWTGSANDSNFVWIVSSSGNFNGGNYVTGNYYGVRPVITISTSEI